MQLLWKLHTTCRRESDFDPATLFGANDDGFYINASDLASQTSFASPSTQGISHLIPPVWISRIQDLGPRGYEINVSPQSAYYAPPYNRPTYDTVQAAGYTLHSWELDGHLDRLFVHGTPELSVNKYDIVVALSKVPDEQGNWQNTGYRGIFSHKGGGCSLFLRGGGPTYGTWGPGWYGASSSVGDTTLPVVMSMVGGASGSFRLNGAHDGTYASTSGQGNTFPFIGGDPDHGQSASIRIYAMLVINRRLTDSELNSLETLFADLAGITLAGG